MTREEIIERMGWTASVEREMRDVVDRIEQIMRIVKRQEREACAAIANEHKEHCYDGDQDWYKCRSIEAAIRARGDK